MNRFNAGSYIQQGSYKSFQPEPICHPWSMNDMGLLNLLGQADREIGGLNAFSKLIPNIDLFIRLHIYKEATLSSKIEGTQTSMAEALQRREEIAVERCNDWDGAFGDSCRANQREPGQILLLQ